MKPRFSSRIVQSLLASLLLLASNIALPYIVDVTPTAPANPSGLWWNPNESGWGMTVTQQSNIMFITIYTYAPGGAPVWYVASNCTVSSAGCSGDLYRVDGGRPLATPWSGGAVSRVGTIALTFSDVSNGTMATVIDQVAATKAITRQLFGPVPVNVNGNRAKTEMLVGGTWTFTWTSGTRRFNFKDIVSAGGGTDDYLATGTNDIGEQVQAGYVSASGFWMLADPDTSTSAEAFTFTFVDANHIAGCYMVLSVSPSTGSLQLSHCADMTGSRTPPR